MGEPGPLGSFLSRAEPASLSATRRADVAGRRKSRLAPGFRLLPDRWPPQGLGFSRTLWAGPLPRRLTVGGAWAPLGRFLRGRAPRGTRQKRGTKESELAAVMWSCRGQGSGSEGPCRTVGLERMPPAPQSLRVGSGVNSPFSAIRVRKAANSASAAGALEQRTQR